MADRLLSENELTLGRAILLATDALGMKAEGALWLRDKEDGGWRYFLVTSLLDTIGPREIFLRLNDALVKQLSQQELENFDFYLAGPREDFFTAIRNLMRTTPYSASATKISLVLHGESVDAVVYRSAPTMDDSSTKTVQRRFRRLHNEMATA